MGRKKVRGREVYWTSDNGNIVVTYDVFGLGSRFVIYRMVYRQNPNDPENFRASWDYVISFTFVGEAYEYARKINDVAVYRYIDDQDEQEVGSV